MWVCMNPIINSIVNNESQSVEKPFFLGRVKEINQIVKDFDRVLEGEFGFCVLNGEAGVGKSYLADRVAQELLSVNVTYIHGKYKSYNDTLLSAFEDIIKKLVDQSMTFSEKKLKAVKKALKLRLGADSNLILSICSDAEKLLEGLPKAEEEDYHKLEYQAQNAIYGFLDIMAQELYPLMIHIDDMQWIDEGSLRMIEFIMTNRTNLNCYFFFSLRGKTGEVFKKIELSESLYHLKEKGLFIELERMSLVETRAYISKAFDQEVYDLQRVAKLFYKATMGSPFYIQKLIENIILDHKITYDKKNKQWQFDFSFLEAFQLEDDIKKVLLNLMKGLSTNEYELLELLSCLGGHGNRKMLSKILTNDTTRQLNCLDKLSESGLITCEINREKDEKVKYYFSHDIIFELIHTSMSNALQSETHYEIVNKLINDPDPKFVSENRIMIASQIMACYTKISKEKDTAKYVYELYYAGLKAKGVTSIEAGKIYFEKALELLYLSKEDGMSHIRFDLQLELAECYYICKDIAKAEASFNKLMIESIDVKQLIFVKSRFIVLYTYSGRYDEATTLCLEVLEHLGFRFNKRMTKWRLMSKIAKWRFKIPYGKVGTLAVADQTSDVKNPIIMMTLLRLAGIAYLFDEVLFALCMLKLSGLWVVHDGHDLSAPAYASSVFILLHYIKDEKKAFEIIDTLDVIKSDTENTKGVISFFIGTYVVHWKSPVEESLKILRRAVDMGVGGGEFQYAGYSYTAIIEMNYSLGKSIEQQREIFLMADEYDERLKQNIMQSKAQVMTHHLDCLSQGEIGEEHLGHLDKSLLATHNYYKIHRYFLEEDYEKCNEVIGQMETDRGMISGLFRGYIFEFDFELYRVLIRLNNHGKLSGIEKINNKVRIDSAMKLLAYWIGVYKENHYARYIFAKARYLEVFEDTSEVGRLYEEGIAFARGKNHNHLVAVGNILAGKHHENTKKISRLYRQEAAEALEKWGADYPAKLLRKKYDLSDKVDHVALSITKNEVEPTDVSVDSGMSGHLSYIEPLGKDETFLYVLRTIVNEIKADYGAIYLEKNDQMHMVYEHLDQNVLKHNEVIHMEDVLRVPHKIMRYVARTGEEIDIRHKPTNGIFVNDTYMNNFDTISLICIPLKYMDIFVGILYVEWNDTLRDEFFKMTSITKFSPLLITKTIADSKENLRLNRREKLQKIPLSKRELEVFMLLIKGLTNKTIGEKLEISLSTVKTHIVNIYSKLEIKNRIAAVEKARQYGLID